MTVAIWFGFHPRKVRQWRFWWGHVEAWGVTADETWWFLDPQGEGTVLEVLHRHDEVTAALQRRFHDCETIYRVLSPERRRLLPIHLPMTCATQAGALLGLRAWTPAGLKRRLRAIGAEELDDGWRRSGEGRSGGEGAPGA